MNNHLDNKLENNPKKIPALIGLKSCSYMNNSIETDWLERAVDVMMARAKKNYFDFDVQSKQVVFTFRCGIF